MVMVNGVHVPRNLAGWLPSGVAKGKVHVMTPIDPLEGNPAPNLKSSEAIWPARSRNQGEGF
jgi:hypothetical protein